VIARFRQFVAALGETFWLVPGVMVLGAVVAAYGLVQIDRAQLLPETIIAGPWLYNGSATGARTLLGAIASSAIGVAGTVFSITIAALSLASSQMGPRLLRNFTRDRGSQITLGAFLGTFSYALMVLRTVRSQDEGAFVPHLSLTVAIVLAFVCVATLVFFVAHMARRINVDTVIDIVSDDVHKTLTRLTTREKPPARPPDDIWHGASVVTDPRRGYLTQLDAEGLAGWAAKHDAIICLLVRPGDFIFPGAPIALLKPAVDGADDAIRNATALGDQRVSTVDLEFTLRQLVEVAVRALSPGVNDPNTAISVVDRLGAALCDLAPVHLPSGVYLHDDHAVLVVPMPEYPGLVDTMFHQIRQNATTTVAVLIRILDALAAAASCETRPERLASLVRHADLVLHDAERADINPSDLADIRTRHASVMRLRADGPLARILL
jgi:uncharacterized membrane protein